MSILAILFFIAALLVSVMIHETGHFVTAKVFGMKATQFMIGFGPTLWSTMRGETEYGIKAIPLGGYVRIVGMSTADELSEADWESGRLYIQQPRWQRLIVVLAGIVTNLVLGYLLLALAFGLFGSIVMHDGEVVRQSVGVLPTLAAAFNGPVSFVTMVGQMVSTVGYLFSPAAITDLVGQITSSAPRTDGSLISIVGMAQVVGAFGSQGNLFAVLVMVAQLNLVLGVMNVLPFPPLDGGHVAVIVIEGTVNTVRRWMGKPANWMINVDIWAYIALAVILYFVLILIGTTILDVLKPASSLVGS
ncbi:site-2 protease family protein [Stomatohabitans albus]|uniref:site-2 protease family protein n=1 Tax=Stomatohabitans albus TaxID=3110766 RepID=UPI00300DA9A6